MCSRIGPGRQRATFFVDRDCHPQTIAVVQTRAEPLGIEVVRSATTAARSTSPDADGLRRAAAVPDTDGASTTTADFDREGHAAGAPRPWSRRPAGAHAAHPAGRARRRHRVGNGAALRRADGLRRPARGLHRRPSEYKRADARPHHRRLARRPRQAGAAHGAPDARAAHPPREGDEQHLHGAGAAGGHGGHVRRLPRPRGPQGDRRARAGHDRAARRGLRRAGADVQHGGFFDTAAVRGRRARRRRRAARAASAASTCATLGDGAVGVSLDETTRATTCTLLASSAARPGNAPSPSTPRTLDARRRRAAGPPRSRARAPTSRTRSSTATTASTRCCATSKRLQAATCRSDHSMIPLGSCTMKLNATSEMIPVTWPEFGGCTRSRPRTRRGLPEAVRRPRALAAEITGFAACRCSPTPARRASTRACW
jgi:glycine dehydrogenase